MIYADYHTHTTYSHGKLTPAQVVDRAISAGLERLAISEHAPKMSYGLKPDDFIALRNELTELGKGRSIGLMLGIEANFLGGGKLDIPREIKFDIVVAGYHRSIPATNAFAASALLQSFTKYSAVERNTDEVLRTLDNYPEVDILAHPNEYIRLNIKRIARYAAGRGMLLEINNRHVTMSVEDLQTAAGEGAFFVISSDGHTDDEMCRFERAIDRAKEAGVLGLVKNFRE